MSIENLPKIEIKPTIIEEFKIQDELILQKTNPRNKFIVKNIIADYGLTHSLDPYFKKYINDYEGLKNALDEFSKKRLKDLLELTKIL
jgi:hypothetical protein